MVEIADESNIKFHSNLAIRQRALDSLANDHADTAISAKRAFRIVLSSFIAKQYSEKSWIQNQLKYLLQSPISVEFIADSLVELVMGAA